MPISKMRDRLGLSDVASPKGTASEILAKHGFHPDGEPIGASSQFGEQGQLKDPGDRTGVNLEATLDARHRLVGDAIAVDIASSEANQALEFDDDDIESLAHLTPQERAVYRSQLKRSEFVESLEGIDDLRTVGDRDFTIRRARKNLKRLRRGIRGAFERELIVAAVRSDLTCSGMSEWAVRQTIADALSCSVTTVDTLTRRGNASLRLAAAMARAKAPDDMEAETPFSFGPPVEYDKRPEFNLERATEGTMLDSDSFRAAICELPILAQHDLVLLLQRQSVEGALDAAETAERRLAKLSMFEIDALDIAGRNTPMMCRMLAKHTPDERKTILADWVIEATHAAIAGTPKQRADAKSNLSTKAHHEIVADWLEQSGRKSARQRPCKSLKTKIARRQRAAKKVA